LRRHVEKRRNDEKDKTDETNLQEKDKDARLLQEYVMMSKNKSS